MADGTRLKTLDESIKAIHGRMEDYQQQSDARHDLTTKHLEALDAKLDQTILLLADTISSKPPPPPDTSPPLGSQPPPPGFVSDTSPSIITLHPPPGFVFDKSSLKGPQNPSPGFISTSPGFAPTFTPPQMLLPPASYAYPLGPSPRVTRIEFPRFDFTEPLDWIYKAERYFEFYQIPPYQRLILASIHMDGPALPWFQWHHKTHQFHSWEEFTRTLEITFGPSEYEDHQEILAKLTQTSTVAEYRQRFDALANRITGVSASFLTSCFISGLRPDIRHEVKVFRPSSLAQAIGLARLQEAKVTDRRSVNRSYQSSSVGISPSQSAVHSKPSNSTPVSTHSETTLNTPINSHYPVRRLSPAEVQRRRQNGLCFTCEEKWTYAHRCKSKPQLFLIDYEEEIIPEDTTFPETELPPYDSHVHSAISFHVMAGQHTPTTFRFSGMLAGSPVQVLLDGGSTHSFIQTRVAKHLQLPILSSSNFVVAVGNGAKLLTEGSISQVPLTIQGHTFQPELYVLGLHGADIILGASWLATLGWVRQNYDQLVFEFEDEGKPIQFKGLPATSPTPIQLHSFFRLASTHGVSQLFRLELIHNDTTVSTTLVPELESLLAQFAPVFENPHELPPSRSYDHSIPLIAGSNPINVRPYRYPHYQKAVIEKMVSEMLADGIIQPSLSPFSSPVVLVHKKDGTWRFCTDYRALNATIVKDRYPIPTVDELFDELKRVFFLL